MKAVFIFLLFLFAVPLSAAGQVIVNEIAWMGTPVEGVDSRQEWRYEWLELYNAGEEAVSLQGWKVELYDEEGLDFTIGLYKNIEAGGYLAVGASEKIPGVDISYGSLAGKFTNDGERIVLKNAGGEVVEEIDASQGWFAGDNEAKLTMERRFPERVAGDPENWGSSNEIGGTPNAQNTLFGKERPVPMEGAPAFSQPKKASFLASLVGMATNKDVLTAFPFAVLAAAALVALRHRLIRSGQGASSSGARKG